MSLQDITWPDGVLGGARMGFRCGFFGCPGERFSADPNPTERTRRSAPPATLLSAPFEGCSRWGAHWGFPIQVFWLPIRTNVFRPKPNGADTEVRPPATLVLAPFEGCFRWGAHGMFDSCFSAVQRTALSARWSFSGNSVPAGRPGGISSPQGPSLSRRLVTGTHEPGRCREKWTCPLNGSGNSLPAGRPGVISPPQGPSFLRRLATGTREPGRVREKWTCPLNGSARAITLAAIGNRHLRTRPFPRKMALSP